MRNWNRTCCLVPSNGDCPDGQPTDSGVSWGESADPSEILRVAGRKDFIEPADGFPPGGFQGGHGLGLQAGDVGHAGGVPQATVPALPHWVANRARYGHERLGVTASRTCADSTQPGS